MEVIKKYKTKSNVKHVLHPFGVPLAFYGYIRQDEELTPTKLETGENILYKSEVSFFSLNCGRSTDYFYFKDIDVENEKLNKIPISSTNMTKLIKMILSGDVKMNPTTNSFTLYWTILKTGSAISAKALSNEEIEEIIMKGEYNE